VGKDDDFLIRRTIGRRGIENASTFTDLRAAEIETQANLDANASMIDRWLGSSSEDELWLRNPLLDPTHAIVYNDSRDWVQLR
jgi:hypothetical protein